MTITTTSNRVVAQGNGLTTQFNYAFLIPAQVNLTVIFTDEDGNQTELTTTQYSVTGLDDPAGGYVTYPLAGPAITAGQSLTIERELPLKQLTTLDNQGAFYPQSVEDALDYLMMVAQQLYDLNGRALVVPITDPIPLALPSVDQRANQLLGFDSNGNPIVAQPSSALVSSAMQPVVSAATLALARAAMGLGNLSVLNAGGGLLTDSSFATVNFATSAVSSNQAPTGANHLTQYLVTGARTFTLARANTYWNGYAIWISALTAAQTVAINAADTFIGQSSGASLNIPVGYKAYITTDAAASGKWSVEFTEIVVPLAPTPGPGIAPGGRLTLTTLTPVLQADVTGATTVFYTPYHGNRLPMYNGVNWFEYAFSEVSQALNDATKSPAGAAANSIYDVFAWIDSSTFRATRGPAWTSGTGRGAGAGTTELELFDGVLMNKNAITNGPAARRGVYLGTIATNGSTQCNMMFRPAAAAGGTANRMDIWNAYNRVSFSSICRDSTNSWTYTLATLRAANASNSNRITMILGLVEDAVECYYNAYGTASTTNNPFYNGIGLDSTSANAAGVSPGAGSGIGSATLGLTAYLNSTLGLGSHFLQALEYSVAAGTTTWFGDNNQPTLQQMALAATIRM